MILEFISLSKYHNLTLLLFKKYQKIIIDTKIRFYYISNL